MQGDEGAKLGTHTKEALRKKADAKAAHQVQLDKPAGAVLPVDKQSSGTQPDLLQDQMRLFAAWLKESNGGEQVTMLTTGGDLVFEADPARIAEGFSMLAPCLFCFILHTPQNPWCALSMGMPGLYPSPDTSAGCTRSQCNTRCTCDMRAYDKEFQARTRARVDLFNSQMGIHDSLICRVAADLVSHAVEGALISFDRFSSTRSLTTTLSADVHLLDPAEQLLTTEALDDTVGWPLEQVVAVMSQLQRLICQTWSGRR